MDLLLQLISAGGVAVAPGPYGHIPVSGRNWYSDSRLPHGGQYRPMEEAVGLARIVGNYLVLRYGGWMGNAVIGPDDTLPNIDPYDENNVRGSLTGPWVGCVLERSELQVTVFACANNGLPIAIDLRRYGQAFNRITFYNRTYLPG